MQLRIAAVEGGWLVESPARHYDGGGGSLQYRGFGLGEFSYTARTDSGDRITGVVEAENEAAVVRLLDEKKLFPVAILARGSAPRSDSDRPRTRVRGREVGVMYGQLADLLGAGVPLLRSLDSLIRSTVNRHLKQLLREVRKSVADGKSLKPSRKQDWGKTFAYSVSASTYRVCLRRQTWAS